MAVVNIENLKAYYVMGVYGVKKTIKAVENINLQINKNEILGIAGESGCGKTTLVKVLSGTVRPPLDVLEGGVKYNFDGEIIDMYGNGGRNIDLIGWNQISYVPQGSMNVLNPVRRIKSTFEDFIKVNLEKERRRDFQLIVEDQLFTLGLPVEVLKSYPHQLSGGMRQRVVIALATILKPDVMFADEPSSALDVVAQRGVIQMLKKIQKEMQNSMVLVSHDMGIHANLADRVAIMYAGNLVEKGSTSDIFKNPLHPYTRYLIGSLPKVGDKSYKVSAPGAPPPLDNPPQGCRFHPRCPQARDRCKRKATTMVEISPGHEVACDWVLEERKA